MAAIPATFWVPLRRSRSWPPPWMRGARGTPVRVTRAPIPLGPPNLWALMATRSTARHCSAGSSQETTWTASVCTTAAGDRSCTRLDTSSRGWIVPISLLTPITLTKLTSAVHASAS